MNSTNVPPKNEADESTASLLNKCNDQQLRAIGALVNALHADGPVVADGLTAAELVAVGLLGDAFRESLSDGRLLSLVDSLRNTRAEVQS